MNFHRLSSAALLLLTGCCLLGSPSQDTGTIDTLGDLKSQVEKVYKTFKTDSPNKTQIASVREQFETLQKREDVKSCNEIQSGQIKKCREMFEGHVKQRDTGAAWTNAHYQNNLENMTAALDLAIDTERNKGP